jgi:probable HAF family extracellular repeat protein
MSRHPMDALRARAALMAIGLLVSLPAAAAPPKYELKKLGRLGHDLSQGDAINDAGHVMGALFGPGSLQRTFLYKNGNMVDISPFLGNVLGWDLNNKGEVVGSAVGGAFKFSNGEFTYLSTPEFQLVNAFDINDLGQVTGPGLGPPAQPELTQYLYDDGAISFLPNGPFDQLFAGKLNDRGEIAGGGALFPAEHAYLYSGGLTHDLGTIPGGGNSFGLAINDSGEVTGRSLKAGGLDRAFLYSNGKMIDLGTLGGDHSFGFGINNAGQVVGVSTLPNGSLRAFVYKNGKMINLGALDGIQSEADNITNNGIVVGRVTRTDGSTTVFIYGVDRNTTHDLNNLVSPTDPLKPFVKLHDVGFTRAANTLGQVLAMGTDSRTAQFHTYIASPIDSTKPLIKAAVVGTLGNNGWYIGNVRITWTVTDAQAPVASRRGCGKATVLVDTVGQKFTCRAKSMGGTASKSVTVKRDTSRPRVTIARPANGAVFERNQVVTASYACADAPAGIASCVGSVANGSRIDTSKKLTNATFRVIATDKAGKTKSATRSYSVK